MLQFFFKIHALKALFKGPKSATYIFWIENDPPPLKLFRKSIVLVALSVPYQPNPAPYYQSQSLSLSYIINAG